MRSLLIAALLLLVPCVARAEDEAPSPPRATSDLFPGAGHLTAAAATGLPFVGIAEAGIGVTNGFAVAAVFGITPSVVTAGLRPRVRVATSERTAFVLVMPLLYYPSASAPGPGNIGTSPWLLARPELFWGGAIGARWQVMGGMGVVGAVSTDALGQALRGKKLAMPAYDGNPDAQNGFAGGIWNTIASRASFALERDTHLFAEAGVVMKGVVPADDVGGPPIVVNVGAQHTF
ncbi:MAG TPA: hypothetical protein VIF62_01330 [Labilithrix sp.]|jgi:hypothetical protein